MTDEKTNESKKDRQTKVETMTMKGRQTLKENQKD